VDEVAEGTKEGLGSSREPKRLVQRLLVQWPRIGRMQSGSATPKLRYRVLRDDVDVAMTACPFSFAYVCRAALHA
jgi:hypothetical protein